MWYKYFFIVSLITNVNKYNLKMLPCLLYIKCIIFDSHNIYVILPVLYVKQSKVPSGLDVPQAENHCLSWSTAFILQIVSVARRADNRAIRLRREVRGTQPLWNFSSKELITQAAVGERQDIWDIYHCSVKGFLSCRCSSRTPAGSTTLAVLLTRLKVTRAHPLTFTRYRERVREREKECVLQKERGGREGRWGCSKSHLPLCALSKQFTLLCVSAARASFAQAFLLISSICRQLETCCSLAASR